MSRLRRIRGRELIAARKRAGFEVARVRGSHHFLRHPEGRTNVVACHAGETIGPGLMRKILRDVEMDSEQFEQFL